MSENTTNNLITTSTMLVSITPAVPADIDDLALLLHSLFAQDIEFTPDLEKQKTGLQQIIDNPAIGEIMVLKSADKIIGMVSLLYSVSTALGGKVAILEDMVIAEGFRQNGHGKQLLQYAIELAKQRQCLRITLLTDFDNETAIRFYQQSGFNLSKMVPLRIIF